MGTASTGFSSSFSIEPGLCNNKSRSEIFKSSATLYQLRATSEAPDSSPVKEAKQEDADLWSSETSNRIISQGPSITAEQAKCVLDYFVSCADRISQMTKTYNDIRLVEQLLEERERDLELAARIGQQLLEQNREIQERNEFLEEQLYFANESVEELKVELQRKCQLLHTYVESEADALSSASSRSHEDLHLQQPSTSAHNANANTVLAQRTTDTLQERIRKLELENNVLQNEASQLRSLTRGLEEKEQKLVTNCVSQLENANKQIDTLNDELYTKSDDYHRQKSEVTRLLKELCTQQSNQRKLMVENEELSLMLQNAQETQEDLSREILDVQDRYTSVVAMLYEAQEELKLARKQPPLIRAPSPDSLYDSLASELEASDSGVGTAQSSARSRPDANSDKADMLIAKRQPKLSPRPNPNLTPSHNHSVVAQQAHNSIMDMTSLMETLQTLGDRAFTPHRQSTPVPEPDRELATESRSSSTRESPRSQLLQVHANGSTMLSKASSTDSLLNYEGPPMGQPGVPGSRDLDYALRRLAARRQVERDFRRFRRERGYAPSRESTPLADQPPMIGARQRSPDRGAALHRSRLRILKPMEGSTTLRHWRALAAPSAFGALAQRLSHGLAPYNNDAGKNTSGVRDETGTCSKGIHIRQDLAPKLVLPTSNDLQVPTPSDPASDQNSDEPSTPTATTPTAQQPQLFKFPPKPTPVTNHHIRMQASPRAFRNFAVGNDGAVGLEAAILPEHQGDDDHLNLLNVSATAVDRTKTRTCCTTGAGGVLTRLDTRPKHGPADISVD